MDDLRSDYEKSKNGWVHFNQGKKKKVKLRKFINERAQVLSKLNNANFKDNRETLISEFNEKGLQGVNDIIKEEIGFYKSKLAKIKNETKNMKDE